MLLRRQVWQRNPDGCQVLLVDLVDPGGCTGPPFDIGAHLLAVPNPAHKARVYLVRIQQDLNQQVRVKYRGSDLSRGKGTPPDQSSITVAPDNIEAAWLDPIACGLCFGNLDWLLGGEIKLAGPHGRESQAADIGFRATR